MIRKVIRKILSITIIDIDELLDTQYINNKDDLTYLINYMPLIMEVYWIDKILRKMHIRIIDIRGFTKSLISLNITKIDVKRD